jgi:UDP-N-acetyl-D-mannosaminuronic acid transferase (WecB/TagA/CpsF family)
LWPDGYFRRRFHLQNINKIPGRDFLKNIQLENSSIIKVYVFGNLENESMKYLQNKFVNQEIVNIKLPYGNLEDFKSHIPIFKENEICLSTLPTPKQEILANYILSSQKYCKFICLGGAVNMAAGLEKPLPDIFKNIFFAETLWRLQFETKRRSIRLLESFYYYFVGEIFRKYQKIEIINEVDEKY